MAQIFWFINRTGKASIPVTKEFYDDPALFLLGASTDVLAASAVTTFPFLTQVTVQKDDKIWAFGEDMVVYEYDPPYVAKDTFSTLRLRGVSTNRIYTFFGIEPIFKTNFTGSVTDRLATRFKQVSDPDSDEAVSVIGKCSGTTLGIIIYDQNFVAVNPLTLDGVDRTLFDKPAGPKALVGADIGRENDSTGTGGTGIVTTSNVPYFLNIINLPLFGNATLQPPKEIQQPSTIPSGGSTNPATMAPSKNADTSTQDQLRNQGGDRSNSPEVRAQKAAVAKGRPGQ